MRTAKGIFMGTAKDIMGTAKDIMGTAKDIFMGTANCTNYTNYGCTQFE